jgi:hypothetical protein
VHHGRRWSQGPKWFLHSAVNLDLHGVGHLELDCSCIEAVCVMSHVCRSLQAGAGGSVGGGGQTAAVAASRTHACHGASAILAFIWWLQRTARAAVHHQPAVQTAASHAEPLLGICGCLDSGHRWLPGLLNYYYCTWWVDEAAECAASCASCRACRAATTGNSGAACIEKLA